MNPTADPKLEAHLCNPRAQIREMVRQINAARYYERFFVGKKDLVFVDLGANLGLVSMYAAPACAKVLAVEPEPTTYEMMKRILHQFPNIIPAQVAVAATVGPVLLSSDPADFSCHTVTNPKRGNPLREVIGKTFDDILDGQPADVCKVDVEGAEMECFTPKVLANAPVHQYYMEVHKTPGKARETNMAEMLSRFDLAHFKTETPRPNAIIATRV